jgi:hypothetical protein
MRNGVALGLGALRLVVAAAIILALAYVLSWQILYSGPVGNDISFHLQLAQWVNSSFPGLHWWYRWDDHGIPYREGYPLAAHWTVVAVSRVSSLDLAQAMQVMQFAITPLSALGLYVFCAWRLRRPLAGLVAGIAYLLSPLTWTFLVDWGFFSNQAGTILFMPAIVALDVFSEEWSAGRRGWKSRLAAIVTMGLVALTGLVSPFLLGAQVAAVFLYVLAIRGGGTRSRARWLFLTAPVLVLGSFLLTAFWSLPQQEYLRLIGTHVPPRAFDAALFPTWGLDQIFSLHPIRPTIVFDRASITLAVWIPALAGGATAFWNGRARVFTALVAFGVLTMVSTFLEQLAWGLPVLGFLVHARSGVTLVQFFVPVLAGLGVVEMPSVLADALAKLWRLNPNHRALGVVAVVGMALVIASVGVGRFANWVDGSPTALAYGGFEPSTNDIWARFPPGTAPSTGIPDQIINTSAWRGPRVGCLIGHCTITSAEVAYRNLFAAPPQRALVDAHVPLLLMALPDLTGGAQAYTYNFQLPLSPELDNWMLDSMLNRRGTTVKAEIASSFGIDAVVLGSTQTAQGADYRALGWTQVSDSPLAFVNPSPTGLATEWPSGAAALVIGRDQSSSSHPFNDLFERATTGMIPYGSGWLVRGGSAYVDDYSAEQLATFPALVLVGYRYHDRSKAFALLGDYVRAGGSLYMETGWQYVDPDWDLGSPTPSFLPVAELRWGPLDPNSEVLVSGTASLSWGPMTYGSAGSGWGASSAGVASIRPGAEAVVSVGGRVVAARWQVGRGRVVWSGMNLIAHAAGARSPAEDQYTADAFAWLLGAGNRPAQLDSAVTWAADDQARIDLSPSTGTTWVLFKESFAPGWSARLQWPGSPGVRAGSRTIPLVAGEADLTLARLESVPPGSSLVFTYGPTEFEQATWVVSLLTLTGLILWVVRPALVRRAGHLVVGSTARLGRVVFGGLARRFSRWGADP